jgi:phosphoribosylaminoimidazole carboxylase
MLFLQLLFLIVCKSICRENICHIVEAPAQISKQVADSAIQVAKAAVGSLKGAGIFGVELFLLPDGQVQAKQMYVT